jgi:hypothetical protein
MKANILKNSLDHIYRSGLLIRHFILRFINNETLLFDNQHRVNLIALLSLLAVSIGFLSHLLLRLYLFGLKPDLLNLWLEKAYFMTITMGLVGIIYTIMWDNLSIDRRDYANLLMLPLRPGVLFISKFLSALVLVTLTTLIFNFLPTLIFSFYLTRQLHFNPLRFGIIHLFTHFLAYLFIFFWIACIQSVARSLSKPRWYRKISTIIQTLLLMVFISLLIWFPTVYPLLSSLKEESSLFVYAFPPLWFVGIGEILMGSSDSVYSVYPHITLMTFTIPIGLYLLGMPMYFRKYLKTRTEAKPFFKIPRFKTLLKNGFNTLVLGLPPVRASFYFSIKTLNRCKKHKMHLLTFWIIPLSVIFVGLAVLYVKYEAGFFKTINLYLVAVPLILLFFLVWGIRTVITYPVNQEANWIFSLKPNTNHWLVARGLKRAFMFSIVFPLMGIMFFFYLYLWGFLPALGHVLFCTTITFLLISILFANYRKLPFISPRVNQKANHLILRSFLLASFLFFIYLFSRLGKYLIENPEYYFLFYLFISMVFFLMQWIRYYLQKELVFSYNPILERVMVGIHLDPPPKHIDLI